MPASTRKAPQTPAERKALSAEQKLAAKIAKLRDSGKPYDGANGICAMPGMPKSAIRCRALLRKHSLDAKRIGPSYERTPAFRAAESARRVPTAKPAAKRTPRKAPKSPAAKSAKRPARS